MSARDDFGSNAGTSASYSGGAGGLGNGGVGGGMGGGFSGGGAGRNGGIGSQTGLRTGNVMLGGVARGRPGQNAWNRGAWGLPNLPSVSQAPLNRPTMPPGLLNPAPVAGVNPVPEVPVAQPPMPSYNPLTSMQPPAAPMSPPQPPPSTSLPPYAGYGTDPRITSTPSPYANLPPYSMFGGNAYSVYGNPQLGTPGFGGLGDYSNYNQGSAVGGKSSMPSGVRY